MASRGQIQIDVVADTSKFAAQVEREIKAVLKGLKLRPIPVDADTKPFTDKVRDAVKDADNSFSSLFARLKSQASKAGEGVGSVLAAGLIGAVVSTIDPITASIVSLVQGIGPAVAASIPVAVGAFSALSIALLGVSDALGKLTDDEEKFNKALADLSPNAQSFVLELRRMALALQEANPIQERLFQGLTGALKRVTAELKGPINAGMTRIAGQLNNLALRTAEYIASARGQEAVVSIFRVTSQVIAEVEKALGPLITKIFDFIASATEARKVDESITAVKETFAALGQAASNVKDSLGSIFAGVATDGPTAAAAIASATQSMKDFLASAEGQEAIATVRDTLGQLRSTAGELLPVLLSLSTGGIGALVTAVQGLLDVLGPLADDLGGDKAILETLGAAIVIATIAVKAYQAAVVLATAAQIAWNGATIAGSAAMVAATAAYNTARVGLLLLSTGFAQAGAAATILASSLYAQVTALAATTAAWIRNAAQAALNTARLIAYTVAVNAVRVATIAWTAVQWLLNAAMTANPIGIVIAIIVALVAAIVIAYNKSETFRDIVQAVFKAITAAAIQLWEWIKAAFNGIVAAFNYVVSAAQSFVTTVISFFIRMAVAANQQFNAIVDFVRSIPGRILSALGNLGSLLVGVGRSIVQGLVDGLVGAWHFVTDRVRSLINLIPRAIRDLLGIGSPSRVTMQLGAQTGQGFAMGVASQSAAVAAAAQSLTAPVAASTSMAARGGDGAAVVGTAGPGVRMWPAGANREANAGTLVIQSGGTKMDDLLVQVISKAVRVRGGNVQQVLGKAPGGVA